MSVPVEWIRRAHEHYDAEAGELTMAAVLLRRDSEHEAEAEAWSLAQRAQRLAERLEDVLALAVYAESEDARAREGDHVLDAALRGR